MSEKSLKSSIVSYYCLLYTIVDEQMHGFQSCSAILNGTNIDYTVGLYYVMTIIKLTL